MQRLTITAHIRGPLITGGGYMTLDALLAAAMFARTGSLDQAHKHLPLAQTEGLYHASAAFTEPFERGRCAIVQGLRPGQELLPWLKKNKQGNVHTQFSNMPDNILNSYQTLHASSVTWYGEGDPEQIRSLLDELPMIGKKRGTEVTRWDIEPGELDGLMGYAEEPLRPVPVWLWKGARNHVVADVTWRPAYWDPQHKAACYVA